MRRYLEIMKPGDLVVVGAIAVIIAVSFSVALAPAPADGQILIQVTIGGEVVYSEPLVRAEAAYTITIPLPREGEAVLSVAGGSVRVLPMEDHLCPRHICSHVFGEISAPGGSIICVPNRLVVELVGSGEPEFDGITR